MNLHELGIKHHTDKAYCHNYCHWYEQQLKGKKIKAILEIGVKDGASLKMWRDFYPDAQVYGIDINKPLGIPGVIEIQSDASKPVEQIQDIKFDLIIDDGSHYCSHQQASMKWLWANNLKKGGIYIMEDLHTSFIKHYQDAEISTFDYLMEFHQPFKLFRRNPLEWYDSITALIVKK